MERVNQSRLRWTYDYCGLRTTILFHEEEKARSIPQTPPSKSKIVSVIKSIPSGKAAGIDGILAEFYKPDPYMAAEVLQPLLEEAWLSESFPEEFTDGIIVKIPKKGNLKITDNHHQGKAQEISPINALHCIGLKMKG